MYRDRTLQVLNVCDDEETKEGESEVERGGAQATYGCNRGLPELSCKINSELYHEGEGGNNRQGSGGAN
ncbi:hypothetical protein MA16_Dca019326 [Dendrobium catenatum]|uniref:Uncharacterized protein n=1 Tax=Dendrobium catenatum TaxID=906689 RepID=A0A2I0WHZ2_9ASPA|nr:hypothetical protein MA16_Dca019326 [Dendrobium catenatum]